MLTATDARTDGLVGASAPNGTSPADDVWATAGEAEPGADAVAVAGPGDVAILAASAALLLIFGHVGVLAGVIAAAAFGTRLLSVQQFLVIATAVAAAAWALCEPWGVLRPRARGRR